MEQETIAVIMTAYNEERAWLVQCMDSILTQTYEMFHLYVLLDNPDNDKLKSLLAEYEKKDERISFYVNEQNMGLVKSLNRLLGMVTEEYVARMDADDVMMPTRLEEEMRFMKAHDLDFVTSNCEFLYADGRAGNGALIPDLMGNAFNAAEMYGNVSMHNTWLLKQCVYEKLDGYRMVAHCEDYDFVLRAVQEGFRIGRMDRELMSYRLRDTSISALYAKEQFEKARMLRYLYKKGRKIADVSPKRLNEVYSAYTDSEKQAFAQAKQDMDVFCGKLYDGRLPQAAVCALKMFFSGREARKMFVNAMWNNHKLSVVYKQAKKDENNTERE